MLKIEYERNTGKCVLTYGRHILFSLGITFVLGGIGALTGPWWLPALYTLLDKANVPVSDKFQLILGIVLILLGATIISAKLALDSWIKKLLRDVQRIDSAQFSVSELLQYFSNLYDDHSYLSSLDSNFYNSIQRLQSVLAEMETNSLKLLCENFLKSGRELHRFVQYNFFIFPNNQNGDFRYCMQPDLNIDRGLIVFDIDKEKKYRDCSKELHARIESTESAWSNLYSEARRRGAFSSNKQKIKV